MKKLAVIVPCYNEEEALPFFLAEIQRVADEMEQKADVSFEFLFVNDGSKDRTQEIGEELVKKYPGIVKLVNKENGGHGDAVNFGLANAEGLYFKVVDSDDWVDEEQYDKLLERLIDEDVDLVLIMSVEPGYGGQKLIPETLEKISLLRNAGFEGLIEVDGGINLDNCKVVKEYDIDIIVAGTAIFSATIFILLSKLFASNNLMPILGIVDLLSTNKISLFCSCKKN